jgi:DNA-binding winged helix-turn-helix (wHTH) protein/TolB-like protein/Flp pilus assembly protein TadD
VKNEHAAQEVKIGDWTLFPALNLLRRGQQEARLEPRYVDLLVYLSSRPSDVVSADDIIDQVWRGQVVGDQSVYQAIARLRKALGDDALKPTYIETVPKRGYRLVAAVTPAPPLADVDSLPAHPAPADIFPGRFPWRWATLALLLFAVLFAWWTTREPDPVPHRPVVALLPFETLSDEPADRYLAEGFAIELADTIGRSSELQVVGPISARRASEMATGPVDIGRKLNADILVSGNLRRGPDRFRVAATVSDANNGRQLWSRIYELDGPDIFNAQRRIAADITRFLDLNVHESRPRSEGDIEAYEAFLLARYHRNRRTEESLQRSVELLKRALHIEPGFDPARVELAKAYLLQSYYGHLPLETAVASSASLLDDLLQKTPDEPGALAALGLSSYLQGVYGLAEEHLERATRADANHAEAWMWLGLARLQQGELRAALSAFETARVLEPLLVTASVNQANALSWLGRRDAAQTSLDTLIETVGYDPQLDFALTSILIDHGDLAAAYRRSEHALALAPGSERARANHALVLGLLRQTGDANEIARDLEGADPPSRAAQLSLDRLALAAHQWPDSPAAAERGRSTSSEVRYPELEWRLEQAREGLHQYFAGSFDRAQAHLGRALDGRTYPIQRTDYDLFLCTTLADTQRRLRREPEFHRWVERCTDQWQTGIDQGWRTLSIDYAGVRLSLLRDQPENALAQLSELIDRGFRNLGLLEADPLMEPLRATAEWPLLIDRLEHVLREAWDETQREQQA